MPKPHLNSDLYNQGKEAWDEECFRWRCLTPEQQQKEFDEYYAALNKKLKKDNEKYYEKKRKEREKRELEDAKKQGYTACSRCY